MSRSQNRRNSGVDVYGAATSLICDYERMIIVKIKITRRTYDKKVYKVHVIKKNR